MFSGFLKKLLFAREFSIIDGEVKILGDRYVMLPDSMFFNIIKEMDEKEIEEFSVNYLKKIMPRLVANKTGMVDFITDIFDIFGFGKLKIQEISWEKKKCIVFVLDTLSLNDGKSKEKYLLLVTLILTGYFSVLFKKQVQSKTVKSSEGAIKLIFE